MKILIATNNAHKIAEIKEIASKKVKFQLDFCSPKELGIDLEPEENGTTFAENAKIKAKVFFSVAKIPVIADDSGLEVESLDGVPGVFSARFAELHNDAANRRKLLNLLVNTKNRNAKFTTSIAFYDGEKILLFEGECKGEIIGEERGENGFGYDSIFVPFGEIRTFAELSEFEKNKMSHRSAAVAKFCDFLAQEMQF